MRPLSLAHLSLLDLPPPTLIRVAARAGFASVGLRLIAVTDTSPGYPLMQDPAMMRETLAALRDTGITVNDIEFVRLVPDFDPLALEPFLAAGAELGAAHIVTAPYDPDLGRLTDNLSRFAEVAQGYGLSPVLEFFPWTLVPDLATASRIVEATGNQRVGILLDTLHFDRSGSRLSDIDRIDLSRLPFLHLCDAEVHPPYSTAELLHTARAARRIPGEGQIMLHEILDHLDPAIPIALEIPTEPQDGDTPDALAQSLFRRTQDFLRYRRRG